MVVLITGSSGFLGKHVMDELERKGHKIKAMSSKDVDLTVSGLDNFILNSENEYLNSVEYILHLSAICGGIGANRKRPATFLEDNIKMSLNVFSSWKFATDISTSVNPKLICLGSVCSYPKFTEIPFREENIWNGYPEETNAPYGIAKRVMMEQMKAYRKQYNMNGIFLIPVNLYGPNDHFGLEDSHVIPALIRKFYDARVNGDDVVELWGTGEACREFLYVKDAAKAIVLAMEKYSGEEPVNIGTGNEIKIKDLAYLIAKKVDYRGKIEFNTNMPDGQPRRCLDVSKAEEYFGFKAETSLDEGLEETIKWYAENRVSILAKGEV